MLGSRTKGILNNKQTIEKEVAEITYILQACRDEYTPYRQYKPPDLKSHPAVREAREETRRALRHARTTRDNRDWEWWEESRRAQKRITKIQSRKA